MYEEHARRLENDIDGELARRTFAKFKTGKVINYQASMYTALVEYEGEARKMLNYAGRDLNDGEAVLFTSTPEGQELVLSAPNGPEGAGKSGFVFERKVGLTTEAAFTFYGSASVTIDWGDGTSEVVITSLPALVKKKTYADSKRYTVTLTGTASRIAMLSAQPSYPPNNGADNLVECTSLGVTGLVSMNQMFAGCYNLIQVPASIPLTVTDLTDCFSSCQALNSSNVSLWDVSNVTNMHGTFRDCLVFNQDVSNWDVSNVTDMGVMFLGAAAFNQDIGGWDVSNVTNMDSMLAGCYVFNQDVSNWDVSNVTNTSSLFNACSVFNQDIGNWDVSNVTDMGAMFSGAEAFNQDISNWDVSNVTYMNAMFRYALNFNQNIGNWDVSNVTDMSSMFNGATAFDQDLGNWDVSNVTDMSAMFEDAFPYNIGLSVANYDNLLVGWAALPAVQPNVTLDVSQNYTIAVSGTARGVLTGAPNNWTITDDGGI